MRILFEYLREYKKIEIIVASKLRTHVQLVYKKSQQIFRQVFVMFVYSLTFL
jgi:hypothetical protein